jgi:hypothetical protein
MGYARAAREDAMPADPIRLDPQSLLRADAAVGPGLRPRGTSG